MATPKKKPTTPWSGEGGKTWSPDIFKLGKKHEGFNPRFVKNDDQAIQRKLNEGWQIANADDYGATSSDKADASSKMIRQGMVLMEMPDEVLADRTAYHDNLTKLRSGSAIDGATGEADKLKPVMKRENVLFKDEDHTVGEQ